MTRENVTPFYRLLGAVLLIGGMVLVGLTVEKGVAIDKWTAIVLGLAFLGGIALLRPEVLDRGVRAAARRIRPPE